MAVLEHLIGWAHTRGILLAGLTVERPSLEDVYLELIDAATETTAVPTTAPEKVVVSR
jgi:ABC-2 type transport system ATP-binding protein